MRTLFKLLLLVVLVAAIWFGWAALLPVTPPQTTFVLLRPGWSTRHIARDLQKQGVIHSAPAFLMIDYAKGLKTLKAASTSSISRQAPCKSGGASPVATFTREP